MRNVYHAEFETDRECEQANGQCQDVCYHNGYGLTISRSFGIGHAVLVLTVPGDVDPEAIGYFKWVLVEGTPLPAKPLPTSGFIDNSPEANQMNVVQKKGDENEAL